jgi:hypothetical protein
MATPLTLNTDRGPHGTPRVIARGEIDLSNIDHFIQALTTASAGTRGLVRVLDISGLNKVATVEAASEPARDDG